MKKMPRDKRAHRKFGDVFGRVSMADFSSWHAFVSSPFIGWFSFALLCVIITFLMTFSISEIPEVISVGGIATRDVRADRDYEIVDKEATDKFIDEAVLGMQSVYDFDPEASKRISENVSGIFDNLRSKLVAGEETQLLKKEFESSFGITVTNDEWKEIVSYSFNDQFESSITSQLIAAMNHLVIADATQLNAEKEKGLVLRTANSSERILSLKDIGNIILVDELKKRILDGKYSKKYPHITAVIAASLVQPNVSLDVQETEARRKGASENVKNVVVKVEAGEIIVRAGSRYEPRHVTLLEGIRREKEKTSTPFKVAGTFLLVLLVIITTFYFAERYIKKFAPHGIDLYFMGFVLILILAVLRISIGLSRPINDSIGLNIPLTVFYYAIPVGGAAMLVRFILNSETAMVFAVVTSIFSGVFIGNNLNYTAYCLISCIAAATSIAYADKRSSIIKAGLLTAVANIFAAIGIQLVNASSITEPLTLLNLAAHIMFAFLGGVSCAVLVTLITPIAEAVFGYTTDIKLLELANLNHPLLRELVIRAPGTYHHSHLVGILAEAASEEIGANPLLTRVAAYYHDIGKIRKPLYFVENTTDCESRHEKLTPNMSALIISSHVKDGIELAQQYKIPKRISDIIVQHHGTKMISFFYDKAKKLTDPSVEKIDEKDFRYQGPKPQTREAGILLLADAVEAAVRSLKEKGPSRIQQMVEDVITNSFTEAQLDECDLTLRNLHDIAGAFTKILMGIYHQRIEYPKEMLQSNGSGNGSNK